MSPAGEEVCIDFGTAARVVITTTVVTEPAVISK
jgi:hypothetical protein